MFDDTLGKSPRLVPMHVITIITFPANNYLPMVVTQARATIYPLLILQRLPHTFSSYMCVCTCTYVNILIHCKSPCKRFTQPRPLFTHLSCASQEGDEIPTNWKQDEDYVEVDGQRRSTCKSQRFLKILMKLHALYKEIPSQAKLPHLYIWIIPLNFSLVPTKLLNLLCSHSINSQQTKLPLL